MKIYKFELSLNGMDDSWYFTNPPTKEDILKGIIDHAELAGKDYEELYEQFQLALQNVPTYNEVMRHGCVGCGGPLRNGNNGTYHYSKYDLREN